MEYICPKNIYEYIDLIRDKPALYVGDNTITGMSCHLAGYSMACFYKGIDEKENPDFGGFHDFVANHYKYPESTAGWKNIILKEEAFDEEKSLQTFFELVDDFRKGGTKIS